MFTLIGIEYQWNKCILITAYEIKLQHSCTNLTPSVVDLSSISYLFE